jgi:hypothetical protein
LGMPSACISWHSATPTISNSSSLPPMARESRR